MTSDQIQGDDKVLNDDSPADQGWGYRLRTVLILVPFVVVLFNMYIGIVIGLTGSNADEIAQGMLDGLQYTFVFIALFGIMYIVLKPFSKVLGATVSFGDFGFGEVEPVRVRQRETRSLNWRTILASANIGVVLCAILFYALSISDTLNSRTGIANVLVRGNPVQQALLGGVSGLFAGSVIGAGICRLDSKATHFTREGITRYVVLFALIIGIVAITLIVDESSEIGDMFSSLVAIILLSALKSGVRWFDKRSAKREGDIAL